MILIECDYAIFKDVLVCPCVSNTSFSLILIPSIKGLPKKKNILILKEYVLPDFNILVIYRFLKIILYSGIQYVK